MAPEIILGEGYEKKVDIWSVGILAYELAEGKTPAVGNNMMEILCHINNSPSPQLTGARSDEFNEFLNCCFEKDPEIRASAKELLRHKFVMKANRVDFVALIENLN